MTSNQDRVLNAAHALGEFRKTAPYCAGCDPQELLTDLLTDLMHHAESQKTDFEAALAMAIKHFEQERR